MALIIMATFSDTGFAKDIKHRSFSSRPAPKPCAPPGCWQPLRLPPQLELSSYLEYCQQGSDSRPAALSTMFLPSKPMP